jgi:hypothetical protein
MNRTSRFDTVKLAKRWGLLAYVGIIGFAIFPFELGVPMSEYRKTITPFEKINPCDVLLLSIMGIIFIVMFIFLASLPLFNNEKNIPVESNEVIIFKFLNILYAIVIMSHLFGWLLMPVLLGNAIKPFSLISCLFGANISLMCIFVCLIATKVYNLLRACYEIMFPVASFDRTKNV